MAARLDKCHTCGAPIFWLRHVRTRRPAPIDADLSIDGNISVDLEAETYRIVAKQLAHINHWVTCTAPPSKRVST